MLAQSAQKNLLTLQTIDWLLNLEIEQRHQAMILFCFKQSKLTEQPTIISSISTSIFPAANRRRPFLLCSILILSA